jgi:hypothetical protein
MGLVVLSTTTPFPQTLGRPSCARRHQGFRSDHLTRRDIEFFGPLTALSGLHPTGKLRMLRDKAPEALTRKVATDITTLVLADTGMTWKIEPAAGALVI